MPATVTIQQHPVGHGGFQTGLVLPSRARPFSWVYDCGSRSSTALKAALREWRNRSPRRIDWLILSHFDYDHLSGLDTLLQYKRVRAVMLPYLNEEATAWALCESLINPRAARYIELLVDPVAWFGRRGVEQIYFVAGEDGDAPDADGDGDDKDDRRPTPEEGGSRVWREIITPRPQPEPTISGPGDPDVFTISGGSCAVEAREGEALVRLVTFRAPTEPWRHVMVVAALCNIAGVSPPLTVAELAPLLLAKAQTSQGRKQIQAIYARGIGSSNRASLSLMAKVEPLRGLSIQSEVRRGSTTIRHTDASAAWFSTGDAELLNAPDLSAWQAHYASDLPSAAIMALPHHGADRNSDIGFQRLNTRAVLTAQVSKAVSKHHPGPKAIANAGGRLVRVTQDKSSSVRLLSLLR